MGDIYTRGQAATSAQLVSSSSVFGMQFSSVIAGPTRGSSEQISAGARIHRHPALIATFFGLASLALLLIGIEKPTKMYFDEPYFVPEARALIQGTPNPDPQAPPLAKPPLGKLIMAVGMKAAGDNSFGWRIAGVISGSLTVVAVYLWTYLLLQDSSLASFAAALALFNNFLFVMSRIATVDVFLMLFLMWSLLAYTAALSLDVGVLTRRILFCLSGVLVGLAGACKWNAVDTLAVFFLVTLALLWLSRGNAVDSMRALSPYSNHVKQIGLPVLLLGLIAAPLASYSLAFWPACRLSHLPFSLHEVAAINIFMWHFNRTTVVNPFLISPWYSWPLNLTPLRVLSYLVGNPFVTWGGLVALALCVRRLLSAITFPEGLVFLLFASNYLQWAVTPQKGLYYYYYYPCVMILGVSIAVALRGMPSRIFGLRISLLYLFAAAIFFVRCYPQMAHLAAPWDCMFGCWP